MQRQTQEIIKKLSEKYSVTELDVEQVVNSAFKTVMITMREGNFEEVDFKNVRIDSLGTFYMSKNQRAFIAKHNNEIRDAREKNRERSKLNVIKREEKKLLNKKEEI